MTIPELKKIYKHLKMIYLKSYSFIFALFYSQIQESFLLDFFHNCYYEIDVNRIH